MSDIQFPKPVTFDTFGKPGSHEATIKVLEESAEFVEAVKRYEHWKHYYDGGTKSIETYVTQNMLDARMLALDEAMDVYQAVSNFLGSPEEAYEPGFDGYKNQSRFNKVSAMGVLIAAAGLFGDYGKEYHRYDEDNTDNVLWNLAFSLNGEFTNEEIVAAYERCKERNRKRGRI